MPVQGSGEWSFIRHTSSAFRWVRRGYSASERGESSDGGGQSFRCSPEGRRSGDVGGAGLLTDFHNQLIDAIPKDVAMLRLSTSRPRKMPIPHT